MNVLSIVCAFPPYKAGIGMVAFREACGFVREKNDVTVTVATMDVGKETADIVSQASGVVVRRLPLWWRSGLAGSVKGLSAIIKQHDVVHLHYPFFGTNELAVFFAWWHNKPLVITYHMDTRDNGWKRVLYAVYQRVVTPLLLRCADVLVCASRDYLKESFARGFFKRFPERCVEIPFGVDTSFFAPGVLDLQFKEHYGIPSHTPYILFVGALDAAHYFKGVHVLLKAYALFAPLNPHHLVIVGDGDMRAEYERGARELGVEKRVHFVGSSSQKDLQKWYQNADFFTLPSLDKSEAFGLVLEEALSTGIPCISTSLPGVRTLIERTDGGVLVTPGNVQELAQAFQTVIKRKAAEPAWGNALRARAQNLFSEKNSITLLYEVYERIVDSVKK